MAFAPRTRLLFLVILLQWPLQLLFVVHACEQCEIDAAESQADGAVAGCVDAWDECDDPKTPQVEGCKDDPPEFLCPALLLGNAPRFCGLRFGKPYGLGGLSSELSNHLLVGELNSPFLCQALLLG